MTICSKKKTVKATTNFLLDKSCLCFNCLRPWIQRLRIFWTLQSKVPDSCHLLIPELLYDPFILKGLVDRRHCSLRNNHNTHDGE